MATIFSAGAPSSSGASIGSFTSVRFDPRRWREAYPYFPFDDMDARWIERLFKAFQSIERPDHTLP